MSILLDPFDTSPPELIPLAVLPAHPAAKIAVTTNVDTPNSAPETSDGETVQGVELSAAAGDFVLLLGQNDPTENGLWLVDGGGGTPMQSEAQFVKAVGPNDEPGYYQQFKVPVSAGTNAGKTYVLVTPPPALLANGVQFRELTDTTPQVRTGNYDLTPPEVLRVADPPFDATYVCKVAVDANQELPLDDGPITLDGVDLVEGDYYLLKGQETATENGVYVVSAGAPAKAQETGLVRVRVTAGTHAGKQFSADQETGTVTDLAPGIIDP